ncbi:MAG TPA: STAS domain-containing protein [bacterium]|nr:STAS domain-containing protein [bacterium]HQG44297.1 STAS domain-containing protein [bacterium]HQI47745.1 STAS domain-containing protein [bacterium]HQJ63872.1 STAS domain-containing protein [bacterium]
MSLHLDTEQMGNVAVMNICGDVDLYSSPQLRKEILKLVSARDVRLVVNLDRVSYMDSSGLATLIEGLQHLNRNNGRMAVTGLRDAVKEVFELTRLDTVFTIYPDPPTAMKWITS